MKAASKKAAHLKRFNTWHRCDWALLFNSTTAIMFERLDNTPRFEAIAKEKTLMARSETSS